jgi:hypothetical protein
LLKVTHLPPAGTNLPGKLHLLQTGRRVNSKTNKNNSEKHAS